jgi:hypothetical protein
LQVEILALDGKIIYQSENKSKSFHIDKRQSKELSFLKITSKMSSESELLFSLSFSEFYSWIDGSDWWEEQEF